MKTLLAIDPGKKGLGVALFADGSLLQAWYSGAEGGSGHALLDVTRPLVRELESLRRQGLPSLDTLLIERPQAYSGAQQSANPEDVAELCVVVGALMLAVRPLLSPIGGILLVRPAEWKGQLPKDVTRNRAEAALTPAEAEGLIMPKAVKTLGHNVWDAVALGLWREGRINR